MGFKNIFFGTWFFCIIGVIGIIGYLISKYIFKNIIGILEISVITGLLILLLIFLNYVGKIVTQKVLKI